MAEVIGGKFWKPYQSNVGSTRRPLTGSRISGDIASQISKNPNLFEARPPIDLSNERWRKLAAALGPALVRVKRHVGELRVLQDSDAQRRRLRRTASRGVITRREWRCVVDFAHAMNAKIVTSFAVSRDVRNAAGVWTPDQADAFWTTQDRSAEISPPLTSSTNWTCRRQPTSPPVMGRGFCT